MTRYHCVVFDLDGTLVDSSHDIARALNTVLGTRGGRSLSAAEVTPLLGEGVTSLVQSAITLAGLTTNGDLGEIRQAYLAEYRAHPVIASTLYDGVEDALAAIARAGILMGVCTNKSESIARQVLTGLLVSDYFPVVVGGDRLDNAKPHPDHLLTTLAELGGERPASLFIGDSVIDQKCGHAAQVDFLAVPWASPEVTADRIPFTDLPAIVTGPTTVHEDHPREA